MFLLNICNISSRLVAQTLTWKHQMSVKFYHISACWFPSFWQNIYIFATMILLPTGPSYPEYITPFHFEPLLSYQVQTTAVTYGGCAGIRGEQFGQFEH